VLKTVSRRLYSDGVSSGKSEIGKTSPPADILPAAANKMLIQQRGIVDPENAANHRAGSLRWQGGRKQQMEVVSGHHFGELSPVFPVCR